MVGKLPKFNIITSLSVSRLGGISAINSSKPDFRIRHFQLINTILFEPCKLPLEYVQSGRRCFAGRCGEPVQRSIYSSGCSFKASDEHIAAAMFRRYRTKEGVLVRAYFELSVHAPKELFLFAGGWRYLSRSGPTYIILPRLIIRHLGTAIAVVISWPVKSLEVAS